MIELLIEVFIVDPISWKKGWNEKLISNIIYVLNAVIVGAILQWHFEVNWLISYLVLSWSIRFALFNYIYNWRNGEKWDYLGLNYWDRWKNGIWTPIRVLLEAWILMVGVLQFGYFACWWYHDATIGVDLPLFCE